jgi:hypothetical protein
MTWSQNQREFSAAIAGICTAVLVRYFVLGWLITDSCLDRGGATKADTGCVVSPPTALESLQLHRRQMYASTGFAVILGGGVAIAVARAFARRSSPTRGRPSVSQP